MKDFLRIANRQAAPQRRVEERKYPRVGADAEGESQDCNAREARRFAQHAQTEAQILSEVMNPIYTAHISALLFYLFHTTQVEPRATSRFFRRHPFCDVFLGCSFEVVAQLGVQFLVRLRPAKQRPQPQRNRVQPMLRAHSRLSSPRTAHYSYLRATIGSTFIALRAGM